MRKISKLNNIGFSHIEMLILVVVVLVVAGIGTYVETKSHADSLSSFPPAPTGLTAIGYSNSQVALTWKPSTPPAGTTITGYDIYTTYSRIATVSGTSTSYSVSGLRADQSYNFFISALDSNGYSSPNSSYAYATTYPGHWQPLGHESTSETTIYMSACVNKLSSTNWVVDGLGVLNPLVSDKSAYTFNSGTYDSSGNIIQHWSSSTWGTYAKPVSARVSFSVDPTKTNYINDYITTSLPITSGAGGPDVSATQLVNCLD